MINYVHELHELYEIWKNFKIHNYRYGNNWLKFCNKSITAVITAAGGLYMNIIMSLDRLLLGNPFQQLTGAGRVLFRILL